jgi:hypothetical protein
VKRQIFLGFDPREKNAYAVAYRSIMHWAMYDHVRPIVLNEMRALGYYRRPTSIRDGRLWDDISEAPMSTEFAISRFLVPHLAGRSGWALFCDSDVLFRVPTDEIFDLADDSFAVMCVKRTQVPTDEAMVAAFDSGVPVPPSIKMDNQLQVAYERKNWTSVMLWNLSHPLNRLLTLDVVNSWPGRDLHALRWLPDDAIGGLPSRYNHLVGIDPRRPDAAVSTTRKERRTWGRNMPSANTLPNGGNA